MRCWIYLYTIKYHRTLTESLMQWHIVIAWFIYSVYLIMVTGTISPSTYSHASVRTGSIRPSIYFTHGSVHPQSCSPTIIILYSTVHINYFKELINFTSIYYIYLFQRIDKVIAKHERITANINQSCFLVWNKFKEMLKGKFHEWYFTQVQKSLNDDDYTVIATQVDLKTFILKPLHANWVIISHNLMSQNQELTKSRFRKVWLLSDYSI